MITCPERERLLELDPRELQDETWQAHLATCEACAEAAGRVLSAYGALDAVLGAAPPLDTTALLARARLTASSADRRGVRMQRLVLLAAACIAGLIVLRDWERSLPGTPFVPSTETPVEWALEGDRSVAVLHTDNPDITVLWFFSGE